MALNVPLFDEFDAGIGNAALNNVVRAENMFGGIQEIVVLAPVVKAPQSDIAEVFMSDDPEASFIFRDSPANDHVQNADVQAFESDLVMPTNTVFSRGDISISQVDEQTYVIDLPGEQSITLSSIDRADIGRSAVLMSDDGGNGFEEFVI